MTDSAASSPEHRGLPRQVLDDKGINMIDEKIILHPIGNDKLLEIEQIMRRFLLQKD